MFTIPCPAWEKVGQKNLLSYYRWLVSLSTLQENSQNLSLPKGRDFRINRNNTYFYHVYVLTTNPSSFPSKKKINKKVVSLFFYRFSFFQLLTLLCLSRGYTTFSFWKLSSKSHPFLECQMEVTGLSFFLLCVASALGADYSSESQVLKHWDDYLLCSCCFPVLWFLPTLPISVAQDWAGEAQTASWNDLRNDHICLFLGEWDYQFMYKENSLGLL